MAEVYNKTKPDSYYQSMTTHQYNHSGGSDFDHVTVSSSNTNYVSTLSGFKNPFWRSQIKSVANASTPCSGVSRHVVADVFYSSIGGQRYSPPNLAGPLGQQDYGFPYLSGLFAYDSGPPTSVLTSVTNRAIVKFLEKADSVRSSFEAGQDIGELKQTIHGLINPMQSLRQLTLRYLENQFKLASKTRQVKALSKAIADSYLEYRFGWRPLAMDIGDAYASLVNNHHFDTVPIEAGASDYYSLNNGSQWNPVSGGDYTSVASLKVIGKCSIRFKGVIKTGAVNGRIGLSQNLQLDLPHFLPTVWDLLPYSWIADYFANVGDVIRAYSFRFGDLGWGNKTYRFQSLYSWSYGKLVDNITVPGQVRITDFTQPTGGASASFTSFQRGAVTPSDLIPRFQFQIPLSNRPWENIGALMVSRQNAISRLVKSYFT